MRIFLTGGAGYIGSACLRWLIRHGHEPIAYDNLAEGNAQRSPRAASSLATSPTPRRLPKSCGNTVPRP